MSAELSIMSRLPNEWHGLFKELGSSEDGANVWFSEETFSMYGSRPTWHKLISSLIKCDPVIEDERLIFKPRFLLLPDKLRDHLVKFLQNQTYIIPDLYIKQFVLGVIGYTNVDCGIHQQLVSLFKETKFSEDLLKDADQTCSSADHNTIQDKQMSTNSDVTLSGSHEAVIILDDSDDDGETREPASKKPRVEQDAKANGGVQEYVTMETDEVNNDGAKMKEESSASGFTVSEGIVYKLKETWHNCISDGDIEELKEVSKLSVKEVEAFCKVMDFDSMSDDSIDLVCQHFCQLADSLSYSSAVCILTFVLGHRVMNLSQKASRKLSGAVTLVSQKFPKQTVDSVLLPCILQEEISAAQSEIMCKIIKDSLNSSAKGYFIHSLAQNGFIFSDSKIPILQAAIDSNCEMTRDALKSFTNCLNDAALCMAKNLKFGKLLLAIVNKHNKLFDCELKNKFEMSVEKHGTFLKKSIQTALNKIKVV